MSIEKHEVPPEVLLRDWQGIFQQMALKHAGTPEATAYLAQSKRYGFAADHIADMRARLEAAEAAKWTAIHLKTGNEYDVTGEAINATNVPIVPGAIVAIYRRDGQNFIREAAEFQDKFKAKETA